MNSGPFYRSPDHAAISTASSNSFSQMKNISDLDCDDSVRFDKHSRPFPQDSPSHTSSTAPLSISSIMSSMSFPTLTNLIPLSWSSSQPLSARPAWSSSSSSCHSTSSSVSEATVVPDTISSRKCRYVSRKKQLRLLRAQMETEGVGTMRTPVQCKKCDRDLVFI